MSSKQEKKEKKKELWSVPDGYTRDEVVKIAKKILSFMHIITIDDNDAMLYYIEDTGMYHFGAEKIIEKFHDLSYQKNKCERVIRYIKIFTRKNRDVFDANPNAINVKNCLLNIFNCRMYAHTHEYPSIVQFPVNYDASAKCDKFEEFLKQQVEPDTYTNIQKMFSYLLLSDCRYQKFFVIVGPPDSGKSVLVEVINAFVGKINQSNLTIQQMTNEKFHRHELDGKIANTFTDLPSEKVLDSAMINAIVSGEPIVADTKYGKSKTIRNRAKLIFSCNNIPFDKSNNPALQKRLLKIEMPYAVPKEQQDLDLIKKLTAEQELSGILNFALDGLQLLLKEGFPTHKSTNLEAEGPLHDFIEKKCVIGPSYEIKSEVLYTAYQEFVKTEYKQRGLPVPEILSQESFGRELTSLGTFQRQRVRDGEERHYVYQGLSLVSLVFFLPKYSEGRKESRYEENWGHQGQTVSIGAVNVPINERANVTIDGTSWRTWYEPLLNVRTSTGTGEHKE